MKIAKEPWWQAAGAIVSVVGVVIAVVALPDGDAASKEDMVRTPTSSPLPTSPAPMADLLASPTPSVTPAPLPGIVCQNGPGNNNTNNCGLLPPQSIGKISYEFGYTLFAWFDGSRERVPTPRRGEIRTSDCDDWDDWLTHTPRLYVVDPVIDFGLEGNYADNVVISKVEAKIFERSRLPASAGTLVKCLFGGGSNEFYNVSVDTLTRKTTVEELEAGSSTGRRPYSMPPGSISLSDGGHSGVRILVESPMGFMYEGSVIVTASINGKSQNYEIGSREEPFRWATPPQAEEMEPDFVAWNGTKKSWVKNYYPYD
ncbi:hypothetical protein O7626_24645 [Micromonospora sp. WMMD1102]|uniref:hypothetical protein n=1 Tax=Micromonospora sp. WMMD1102 TaxID=3016105 RepID=UPI002414FA28|nr:hypothetical protein [Micromonospora sp. WMMD1102]MDG4789081.1 hypothetical protein [Micromonospora sp. WMMD1102]